MSNWNQATRFEGRAVSQEWDIFTSMVCTSISWVITMVCSDHQEIIFFHSSDNFRQALVKFMQAIAVALWITTMSVKGIKVYQVCERETMFKVF